MSDKNALDSLLDFKDLRKNKLSIDHSHTQQTGEQSASDHQNILRSFKELRQKLKLSQKENNGLKQELKIHAIRLKQNQQALEIALASNVESKAQIEKQAQNNFEMRRKLSEMKDQLRKCSALEEELAFTKEALLESKLKEQSLSVEKNRAMELFLQQKMELEEEITKLAVKARSNENFISELEQNCAKSKEINYKLENKVRKMSISFEQTNFNHQFKNSNFETQHLVDSISELEKQITTLKGKLAKEKQRRYLLEEQMIHLEESAGINNVKATTFEGQSQMLAKKHSKLVKKMEDLNHKLQKGYQEKISLEEQTIKYQMFSEELIVKLKPLLNEELNEILVYYEKKLKNMRNGNHKDLFDVDHEPHFPLGNITEQNNLKCNRKYENQEKSIFNIKESNNYLKNYETNPVFYKPSEKKQSPIASTRFTFADEKENEVGPSSLGLEGKIRRERDEMQKKIKEKWFQKKFECSLPSQVHKLRAEYITTFIDR